MTQDDREQSPGFGHQKRKLPAEHPKPTRLTKHLRCLFKASQSSQQVPGGRTVALAFWPHPSPVITFVWYFHICSRLRKTLGISQKPGDCTPLVKGVGWFDLMALPNGHINPTVPAPADSVLECMFYGYLLPKHTINKSKLLCISFYHQRNSSQNSTPHPPHV